MNVPEPAIFRRDPVLHTHIDDCLPDFHPLAWVNVYCLRCHRMVHAGNNECMSTWLETGRGNYCIACFVVLAGGLEDAAGDLAALDDDWGLLR